LVGKSSGGTADTKSVGCYISAPREISC